jgi:hypothetical protein
MGTISPMFLPSPEIAGRAAWAMDHRMDLSRGIRYLGHARDQMRSAASRRNR